MDQPSKAEYLVKTIGPRFGKTSLWLCLVQLVLFWTAYFFFRWNVRASEAVHSFLASTDELTPALRRLKAFYAVPVDDVRFSQEFSTYIVILICCAFVALIVFGLAWTPIFWNFRIRSLGTKDIWFIAIAIGLAIGALEDLLVGPSSMDHRNLFIGLDYLQSLCLFLPIIQTVVLLAIGMYLVVGRSIAWADHVAADKQ